MTTRPRRPEDLPACVAVLGEVHRHDGYPEVWQSDAAGWLDPQDVIAAWVAEVAGQIVGHVCLTTEPVPEHAHRRRPAGSDSPASERSDPLRLSRLFVAPTAQGQGVARALIASAVSWAQGQGRTVILEVDAEAEAVAVYERLGWRFLTSGPGSWTGRGGRQPIVRYYAAPG